jgi:hypothetical protein
MCVMMGRAGRLQVRQSRMPVLETIERRQLPGTLGVPIGLSALVWRFGPVKDLDSAGLSRLLAALRGGAGAEFRQLLQKQVKNPMAIVAQFASGQRTTFETPGFAARTPKLLPTYTGPQLDQFNPIAAGAVVLKNGQLSLAAIMRGPIDRPETVRYIWGFDLGRGAITPLPSLANVRADTLVTVERVGGRTSRLFVTDLTTSSTHDLDPRRVLIQGPVVRLRVNPVTELAAPGTLIKSATFAFWTESGEGGSGAESAVGRVLPNYNLRVGVLNR